MTRDDHTSPDYSYKPVSLRGMRGLIKFWRSCYLQDKQKRDHKNGYHSAWRLTECELELAIAMGDKP